ncbi:MAG: RDD family protein [Candidatus Sulfotelmatobacter sp.]
MSCLICGEICRCSSSCEESSAPRWLPDVESGPVDAALLANLASAEMDGSTLPPADETVSPENVSPQNVERDSPEDSSAWRMEVAARLNRYNSRRKPRPPRYPSLRLRFDEKDGTRSASADAVESTSFPAMSSPACDQALALDRVFEMPEEPQAMPMPPAHAAVNILPVTAKILEFPRSWTPPPAPLDELAEPVFDRDRPRILEAPELVPPPPALGGITIEPAQLPELEKRPGIDIPLQSAPLGRRVLSAFVDGVIIAAACALFGFIFWKVTALRPPRLQIAAFVAGLAIVFWAAYQYLLVVYAGTTPGLRASRLELARFDGSSAGRRLRRWRVLASFLSAASLGMGYVWVFLDEDSLCWHDRITHTYLAPKSQTSSRTPVP